MQGSHKHPSDSGVKAVIEARRTQLKQSLAEGMDRGLTPIPLERPDTPSASRPHHPLVSNRRDELSGALRRQMKALSDEFNSLEQNIDTLQFKSKDAERAKAAILANLSHEFRTPLNAILGFSELLLSETVGPLNDDRQREYIGDIHRSGLRLLTMIDGLLDNAEFANEQPPFISDVSNALEVSDAPGEGETLRPATMRQPDPET
jgi:signal transduction histidine kinase